MSLPRSIPSRGWQQEVPEGDEEADTCAIPIPSIQSASYGAFGGSINSRSAGRLAVSEQHNCCAASATAAATLVGVRRVCALCSDNGNTRSKDGLMSCIYKRQAVRSRPNGMARGCSSEAGCSCRMYMCASTHNYHCRQSHKTDNSSVLPLIPASYDSEQTHSSSHMSPPWSSTPHTHTCCRHQQCCPKHATHPAPSPQL